MMYQVALAFENVEEILKLQLLSSLLSCVIPF